MANPDAGSLRPPPNLRVSDDEGKECDSCKMFTQRNASEPWSGRCTGYSLLPVDGEWVCDSFEASDKGDIDETAQEDQPKSLAEARIKVREHYRRRRTAEGEA